MSARLLTATAQGRELREASRRLPARALALAVLTGLTSLAIGRAFSWWLVPGYLALMSWLVAYPRPDDRPAREADLPAADGAASPPGEAPVAVEPNDSGGDNLGTAEAAEAPTRSRRRSRRAKPKPLPDPPAAAVWIRVGPGQFVRAEAPAPAAEIAPAPAAEEKTAGPPDPPQAPAELTPAAAEAAAPARPRRYQAVRVAIPQPQRLGSRLGYRSRWDRPRRWRAGRRAAAPGSPRLIPAGA